MLLCTIVLRQERVWIGNGLTGLSTSPSAGACKLLFLVSSHNSILRELVQTCSLTALFMFSEDYFIKVMVLSIFSYSEQT